MENQERKIALYDRIGELATTGSSSIEYKGQPPKPKTFVERYMDKRLLNRSNKAISAKAKRIYEVKNTGGERTDRYSKKAKVTTAYEKHKINKDYRAGNLTAAEKHIEKTRLGSHPNPSQIFETNGQKMTRKGLKKADKRVHRSAVQPRMQVYRHARRLAAQDDIHKHYRRWQRFQ